MNLQDYRSSVRAQLAAEVSEEVANDEREIDLYVRFQIDQSIKSYEASINNAFTMVRRRQAGRNSVAKGRQTAHERTMFSFFLHAEGSVTPWRTQASNSAGRPPTINMARQP